MPEHLLECSMLVPRPLADVFAIYENPSNLGRITPPWLNFRIATKEKITMREGARIDYVIRWMGVPMRWRTVISTYDPPYSFVDEQERGPYSLWRHTHTFEETEEGVLVGDEVRYRLPLGAIGQVAHGSLVAAQLRAIFRYRQKAVAQMFGVPLIERVAPRILRVPAEAALSNLRRSKA
ncbi:MAG: SRPBCC family protein [Bryobacterales bacterium]|nr:SRPBCC family protein [Bryobacterales bacterium]